MCRILKCDDYTIFLNVSKTGLPTSSENAQPYHANSPRVLSMIKNTLRYLIHLPVVIKKLKVLHRYSVFFDEATPDEL